jgi:hypothetical protein
MNHTEKLKAALWQCYGNPDYPAEWDGKVYGGGKLSQRFWEYHAAIDLLELTPDSVVLDIGGGSPVTGAGLFTRVIAPFVREVHVMDMNIKKENKAPANIKFHPQLGSRTALLKLFQDNPQITHVACISVFEHIPHEVRCGMVQAINEAFAGNIFVTTLEYHPKDRFFEHQLTTQTLSEMLGALTKFYPDSMHKSPFWCDNAYRDPSLGRGLLRRLGIHLKKETEVPLWYPVALRFRSSIGAQ